MRKAAGGLKRGSRRKQQPQQQHSQESASESSESNNTNSSSSHSIQNNSNNSNKRKQTQDEAALTAKNYRLAKELSELRVRHRDETKNVTRLTMENMNLASRCREAISHVAMLKKELVMHQRKAAQALALQREQSQRGASNVSESGSLESVEVEEVPSPPASRAATVAADLEEMDRLMSPHNQDPRVSADFERSSTSSRHSSSPSSTSDKPDGQEPVPAPATSQSQQSGVSDVVNGTMEDSPMDEQMMGLFPKSASPLVSRKHNYNDDFPADITPASIHHERRMPAVEDIEEQQENDADGSVVSSAREDANKKLSNIDAFEASFSTEFPDSFNNVSPTSEGQNETELYNPFYSGPSHPVKPTRTTSGVGRMSRDESASWSSNMGNERPSTSKPVRERSPVAKNIRESPPVAMNSKTLRERSPLTSRALGSSRGLKEEASSRDHGAIPRSPSPASPALSVLLNRQRMKVEEDERIRSSLSSQVKDGSRHASVGYDRADGASTPNIDGRSGEPYHTPPHSLLKSPEGSGEHPRRPEKSASLNARARYERALHPRGEFGGRTRGRKDRERDDEVAASSASAGDAVVEEGSTVTSHSPSMAPKRLQQRRERERGNSDEASISSHTSGTSHQGTQGQLVSTRTAPGSDDRRKFGTSGRSHRPTPVVRDTHALPFDEDDKTLLRMDRSEKSGLSQSDRSLGASRRALSETHSDKLSSDPMIAESRALDAMATGGVPSGDTSAYISKSLAAARYMESIKQRRSTKQQPVSYAEPALNSKLRRGDVYFPKTTPNLESDPVESQSR